MESRWLAFYRGTGTDSEDRTIEDILAWDDGRLESVHDFIQWLFPLPEPSMFNPHAPLLTPSDIAAAREDGTIQSNLRAALLRMRRFYGLTAETAERPKHWVRPADHNHLRMTRMLRSLTLLGLAEEARQLYEAISEYGHEVPERTRTFWRNAIGEP